MCPSLGTPNLEQSCFRLQNPPLHKFLRTPLIARTINNFRFILQKKFQFFKQLVVSLVYSYLKHFFIYSTYNIEAATSNLKTFGKNFLAIIYGKFLFLDKILQSFTNLFQKSKVTVLKYCQAKRL